MHLLLLGGGYALQACVRRRAIVSVAGNPACGSREEAEKAVNEVWESCFNDTRPFDEARVVFSALLPTHWTHMSPLVPLTDLLGTIEAYTNNNVSTMISCGAS